MGERERDEGERRSLTTQTDTRWGRATAEGVEEPPPAAARATQSPRVERERGRCNRGIVVVVVIISKRAHTQLSVKKNGGVWGGRWWGWQRRGLAHSLSHNHGRGTD